MDLELEGKVAVITGAASGIGRATAESLAGMGVRVVASDVDGERGEALVGVLRERGGEAAFVAADVTDAAALDAVVARAVDAFGRLDCAVNCAGVGGGHARTHEYPEEQWDRIVATNLKGTWLSMSREIAAMLELGAPGASSTSPRPSGCAAHRGARPTARASTASSGSPGARRSSTRRRGSASTRSARVRSTRR